MLFEGLCRSAERFPQRAAAVDPRGQIAFGPLCAAAAVLGRTLSQLSPGPDEPIALLMPASVGFVVAFHAIQSAGRIVLPLNMTLAPPELAAVLTDSGARLVVTCRLMQPVVDGLTATGGLPAELRFVWMEELQRGEAEAGPVVNDGTWQRSGPRIEHDQPAVLLYTSGSTGQPKGVMLSAGNMLANSLGCIELARISPDKRFVGLLPLFHAFGLTGTLLVPNLLGATAYYLPRFQPRQALELIRGQRISVAMAIPSMYGAMLKAA